jgi:23S rRNA (cytosine1962-C5)-methyltransferase
LRPDPQAVWPFLGTTHAHAHYIRSDTGGGHWEFKKPLPESWTIDYKDLTFRVRPTGFKHTGLFPEQAVNWDWMREKLKSRKGARVLNLFAYTGAATCACLQEGAEVVHVDAAKSINTWAKENVALCGLSDAPVRFLADDAMKFVAREKRRGNKYDAIVMDPPSYGRGPGGEMWKIEKDLYPLVEAAAALLSAEPLFFLINSYTTGLAPSVLKNILQVALKGRGAEIISDEIGLPIEEGRLLLPCGASGRASFS